MVVFQRRHCGFVQRLKSVTEGFVACCEEGNFGAMKKAAAAKPMTV